MTHAKLALAAILAVTLGLAPTPDGHRDEPVNAALQDLHPGSPEGYLHLAEDLLDAEHPDTALPRRLLVLCALNARRPGDATVRASACLALASIEPDPARAEWVRAVAHTASPDTVPPTWAPRPNAPARLDASPAAATALARLASGRERQFKLLIDEPGVRRALEASPELAHVRRGQAFDEWAAAVGEGACDECRGEGFTVTRDGPRRIHTLCPSCEGEPAHALAQSERIWVYRAQLALLDPGSRPWSTILELDAATPPAPVPDIARLPAVLGIDNPGAPYWRDGRWVSGPGARP